MKQSMASFGLMALAVAVMMHSAVAAPFSVSGVFIDITKSSGPDILDNSWVSGSWCYGQVLYNISNVGDRDIDPFVWGPITVKAPAGSEALLSSPGSFLYQTDAAEGASLATGIDIYHVGYYTISTNSTYFALTVKVNRTSGPYPAGTTTCTVPAGTLPNTFLPSNTTGSAFTSGTCPAGYTLVTPVQCVKVERFYPAYGDKFDNDWIEYNNGNMSLPQCYGMSMFKVTNGGLKALNNFNGDMVVNLQGAKIAKPLEYLYTSSNVARDSSTFNIQKAGYYMAPNMYSFFSLTTYCNSTCPCAGFSGTTITLNPLV